MQSLAGMTKLRKFWARDTRITDKTLKILGGLRELEDLDIGGTDITEAGVADLARLTGLKKLNVLGADLTDAGLDALAGMKNLESLNLYRTKVSNAGLEAEAISPTSRKWICATLAPPKRAWPAWRAALPHTELIFLDSSVKPPGKAEATVIAGKGDKAVADWVKSIGGRAVMEGGALVEAYVSAAPVTDESLKNFDGSVSDTGVTGALLDQLAGMKQLKTLFLAGAKVTAERVEQFRKARPDCRVVWAPEYKEVKPPEDTRLIG